MAVNTPTELVNVGGVNVWVKREDLYSAPVTPPQNQTPLIDTYPPPFAKPRGLIPYLASLKKGGAEVVAYMDTTISMAGWALAYYAPSLGLHPVVVYPRHKDGVRHNVGYHADMCKALGAEVLFLQGPTQMGVNWYRARKMVTKRYPKAVLLPQGLPFAETVQEVAREVKTVPGEAWGGTVVIAIGSGTMAAGVITGMMEQGHDQNIIGILVSSGNVWKKQTSIQRKVQGLLKGPWVSRYLVLMDNGWKYEEEVVTEPPFPCNPHYDRKAWHWLVNHIGNDIGIARPILFWNIGA